MNLESRFSTSRPGSTRVLVEVAIKQKWQIFMTQNRGTISGRKSQSDKGGISELKMTSDVQGL